MGRINRILSDDSPKLGLSHSMSSGVSEVTMEEIVNHWSVSNHSYSHLFIKDVYLFQN